MNNGGIALKGRHLDYALSKFNENGIIPIHWAMPHAIDYKAFSLNLNDKQYYLLFIIHYSLFIEKGLSALTRTTNNIIHYSLLIIH